MRLIVRLMILIFIVSVGLTGCKSNVPEPIDADVDIETEPALIHTTSKEPIDDSAEVIYKINRSLGTTTEIVFVGKADSEICFEDNLIMTKDLSLEGNFNSTRTICLISDFIVKIDNEIITPSRCEYTGCGAAPQIRDAAEKLNDLIESADSDGAISVIDEGLFEGSKTCFANGKISILDKEITGNILATTNCYTGKLKIKAVKESDKVRIEVLEYCGNNVCAPFEDCILDCGK